MSVTYRQSGVDIDKADQFVESIKPYARMTRRPEVIAGIGGFGALCGLPARKFKEPVLVSSTDGVGTKLKVAKLAGRFEGIGIDLVAMNVNDILTLGAEPLFFLDYFAIGKLDPAMMRQVVRGIAKGCKESGCALIGGETAEMPGLYRDGDFDLAGFCVGVVDREKIVRGRGVYEMPDLKLAALNFLYWRGIFEPAHFIMERKMILGIKERAERLAAGEQLGVEDAAVPAS